MTSELRVDNLKGSTTGGSINVLGEGTSATTNLQQGLTKVWLSATSTTANQDSFNRSSGTDNNTGNYTHTFINNMGNATYNFAGAAETNLPALLSVASGERLTSSIQLRQSGAFDGTGKDCDHTALVNGDLA